MGNRIRAREDNENSGREKRIWKDGNSCPLLSIATETPHWGCKFAGM